MKKQTLEEKGGHGALRTASLWELGWCRWTRAPSKNASCHLRAWAPRWTVAPPPLLPVPQPHSQLFL